jgi:hypothetical protein
MSPDHDIGFQPSKIAQFLESRLRNLGRQMGDADRRKSDRAAYATIARPLKDYGDPIPFSRRQSRPCHEHRQ